MIQPWTDLSKLKELPSGTLKFALVTVGLLLAGGISIVLLRKYLRKISGEASDPGTFNLDQLRQMKDNGQISEEEYKTLRARIVRDMI